MSQLSQFTLSYFILLKFNFSVTFQHMCKVGQVRVAITLKIISGRCSVQIPAADATIRNEVSYSYAQSLQTNSGIAPGLGKDRPF
jgi:hypothetical protein